VLPGGSGTLRFVFAIRSLSVLVLSLVLAACTATADPATTVTTLTTSITTTTTAPTTTVSTEPAPEPCDPPGFLPTVLPDRVVDDEPDVSTVPLDEFTLQPGTIVTGWTDEAGNPVVVFVRGGLPPQQWIATPEPIELRGVEAALGNLGDGIWAVAWFEGPDRCDEYYLVFYPPTSRDQAVLVVESLTGSG
jgi:hypothetical protein